jgi:hypothetical protein
MRFVHTFWSTPALSNRWNVNGAKQLIANIWYYSTSVAYLKSLGQYIELHTDDFGKKCLDHIPYDNIYTTLNSIPENINPIMWAYGKFWGCKDLDLGYIHIDGDVFIKSQKTLNAIGYGHDALVQGHEFITKKNYNKCIYPDTEMVLKKLSYPVWSKRNCQHAYNVGILQFNNQKLKDTYFKTYFDYANKICANKQIVTACEENRHLAPDLVLEQQWLYEICNYIGIKPKILLAGAPCDDKTGFYGQNFMQSACDIDYQHVIGSAKYNDSTLGKCKLVLKKINPNLFESTLRKIEYIQTLL